MLTGDAGGLDNDGAAAAQDCHVTPGSGAPPTGPPSGTAAHVAQITRRLIILATVLIATIFGLTGLLTATQRADDIVANERATDDLAQVLAEQTSRTIQPVDLTLREIQGRLTTASAEAPDSLTGWSSKATFDLLVERLKGLPQVDALMLTGADGHLMNFSRAFPPVSLDASKRDYFQFLSTHDDHALFVSAPVKGYLAGKWTVFLSRRINDPHGAFAGVVMAAVTLSYLEDFYRAVTPADGSVTLLRPDGLILVRYPEVEDQIGQRLPADAPWYRIVEAGGGSYRSPGYVDGAVRLVSARPLREFPLVIDVTTLEATALNVWRRQAVWLFASATTASACVIFLLWIFGRQYSRLVGQNAQLETGRLRFDAVLDSMSQGLTFVDADQKLMICNRRYAEIHKLPPDLIRRGTSLPDIVNYRVANGCFPDMTAADYLARREGLGTAAKGYDITDEFRDGRTVSMHYQPLPSGGWVTTHEEITERRQAEAALAFMARHDALTRLPNRVLFQERLDEAIALTRRGGHCALLCLGLDQFKVVNDTLGHVVGDGLLRAVATRLSSHIREGDTVARLGGDEFAIILPDLKSPEPAERLAERLISAFGDAYEVDGHRIMARTSIGISIAPKDGTLADTLLKSADVALYHAKAEGPGTYRFFEPKVDSYIQQRRAVELDLRNANPAEDFVLHYQPVLDLSSGRVTGFEALIRWHHPVRGMVSPGEFIPIAEQTGLIVPIGAWALRQACQEAAGWPADIEVAVNLSPVQFKRGQILDVVQQALTASGLDPRRLELEITESVLMENSADRLAVLHQIRALGIRIALDDFGTGYSSLSYLRSFPFDKIKIDQSFVRDLDTCKESAAIVGAIVGLARTLGMTTVAEGVETVQQLVMVRDQGCQKVQGYLFSRPRPAHELSALILGLEVPRHSNEIEVWRAGRAEAPRSLITDPVMEGTARAVVSESALPV